MSSPDLHVIPDPGLGNSAYVLDLGRRGLRAAFAADTHLHADFVTGAVDLARRDGATLLASAAGDRACPHRGLLDGTRSVGVFTGGSLTVGGAARTDLVDPDRTEALARAQHRSLRRLAGLADDVAVWPTHGGGSFCSVPSGGEPTSTIGAERATNPLLSAPDEDAFVRELLGSLGTYPPYFARLPEVNRQGPPDPGAREVPALSVEQVRGHWPPGPSRSWPPTRWDLAPCSTYGRPTSSPPATCRARVTASAR